MAKYIWFEVEKHCIEPQSGDIICSGSGKEFMVMRSLYVYWLRDIETGINASWPMDAKEFRRVIKVLQHQ